MRSRTVDYYAILQVHPTADEEVIRAAYRQLMRKYHPDRAGDDPLRSAELTERAKAINEAYAVLGDESSRRAYDAMRFGIPRAPVRDDEPVDERPAQPQQPSPEFDVADYVAATSPQPQRSGILGAVMAAYFLLPGAYEWERGYRSDALPILLVPVISLTAWALATDRLRGLLGNAPMAPLVAWVILVALTLPLLRMAPRIVAAAVPSALLVSGLANGQLAQAHVPGWLAWLGAVLFSMTVAPRVFVFGVLPTLGLYLLLARIT
ncbi:MAG: J domain-containing protein [Chloroflexi bacterium]|nr:J domain-containing protein [Chloroflexota bacterium]